MDGVVLLILEQDPLTWARFWCSQSLLGSHDMRRIRATLLAFFEAGLDTFTS